MQIKFPVQSSYEYIKFFISFIFDAILLFFFLNHDGDSNLKFSISLPEVFISNWELRIREKSQASFIKRSTSNRIYY